MAESFKQIQEGTLRKEEVLSKKISELNQDFDIDPDSAELTDGTITLTVNSALNQMITISHNYAALLLAQRIEMTKVKSFLVTNNFSESNVGQPPKTSAYDIALFFERLYKGELASKQYTDEMLDLLKTQKLNDKLPKYLPKNTVIAHKTGEIDFFSNDAGIVFSEKGDYLIVVLSETDFPAEADDRIGQISKAVYEYFNQE